MTKFSAPQQNQLAQIGAYLRDNREKQAKSLEDIAIRTYIRPQLLNGIESGNPELLPEPIFVQGFIRRYAEALGINGQELSQQFTVDSIPSTPRPARQPEPQDSPTTRITRATTTNAPPPAASAATAKKATPMFSAGSSSPLEEEPFPTAASASTSFTPVEMTPTETTTVETTTANTADAPLRHNFSESTAEFPVNAENSFVVDETLPVVNPINDKTTVEPEVPLNVQLEGNNAAPFENGVIGNTVTTPELGQPALSQPDLNQMDLGSPDAKAIDDVFASKVAEFDEQNMVTSRSTQQQPTFDDELPAAFTTQPAPSTTSVNPETSTTSRSTLPVGVEYGSHNDAPNLKPFIIGGILAAALTAGMVVFASLLGGGDREPSVASESSTGSEGIEQPADTENPETPVVTDPVEPPGKPALSDAPVYVEATATSEAWVSILADGNLTPIFEGTLQPGDTQVWEAQENISVYSGDAGALELAANGEKAEVMGEAGQPTEKIFP